MQDKPSDNPQADFAARRERALELSAQGVQRDMIAYRLGLSYNQVRYALEKARAEGDPRATPIAPRAAAGGVFGVPRDLAGKFHDAAKARGMSTRELRRRILDVVTRDDLFDALDLCAKPKRGRKR